METNAFIIKKGWVSNLFCFLAVLKSLLQINPVLFMARGPDAFFYGFTGIINLPRKLSKVENRNITETLNRILLPYHPGQT